MDYKTSKAMPAKPGPPGPPSLGSQLAPLPPCTMDGLLARLGSPGRHQTILVLLLATNLLPVMFLQVEVLAPCEAPLAPCDTRGAPSNTSQGPPHTCREEVQAMDCSSPLLLQLLPSSHLLGLLLGGLLMGGLADSLGRKPVMLATLYSHSLLAIGLHWVAVLEVVVAVRVVQGVLVAGLQVATYCLVLELVGPGWRGVATATLQLVWTLGMLVVALVARFVGQWRFVQLVLHVPTLATLLYVW